MSKAHWKDTLQPQKVARYHHLKMLMDQVFAGMYQATFVWKRRSGSNDAKGAFVSTDHEYVVCYAGKGFAFGGEKKSFENYTNPDGDIEPWVRGDLTCNKNYVERPNTFYPIRNPMTDVWYPNHFVHSLCFRFQPQAFA